MFKPVKLKLVKFKPVRLFVSRPPSGPFQAVGGGGGVRVNPPNPPQPTGTWKGRGSQSVFSSHYRLGLSLKADYL